MACLFERYPETEFYRREAERYTRLAEEFGEGGRTPRWSPPRYPETARIPNETTIVVITSGLVASAGEGFVLRVSSPHVSPIPTIQGDGCEATSLPLRRGLSAPAAREPAPRPDGVAFAGIAGGRNEDPDSRTGRSDAHLG